MDLSWKSLLNIGSPGWINVQTNWAYWPEGQGSFQTKIPKIQKFCPDKKGAFREILGSNIYGDYQGSSVDGLTDYIIRHHFLKGKYDIITVPPSLEKMHRCRKPFSGPGQVLGRLGDTEIHIIASDKMLSDQDQEKILDLICYILEISLSGHVF